MATQIIIPYLVAMCLMALLNAVALMVLYRKQVNLYFGAIFLFIIVANFGHLFIALSESVEAVTVSNKACYLGSCFLPMFEFFAILQICRFRFPSWIKLLIALFSVSIFAFACTIGLSDIYYKSIEYVHLLGVGSYVPVYGPMHCLWIISLVGYFIGNVITICLAWKTKKIISYKSLVALSVLCGICVVSFFVSCMLGYDTLVMPFTYIVVEFILFFICLQIKMTDISECISEALEAENVCAYIAFSDKGFYLGCNDIALQFFPELRNFHVDWDVPNDCEIARILASLFKRFSGLTESRNDHFVLNDKFYNVTLKEVNRNRMSSIYLFQIEDDTKLQRYINRLDTRNSKLYGIIKNNADHIHAIQEQMIVGMAKMVESRDSNTGGHIKRTSQVVSILVEEIKKLPRFNYSDEFYNALIAAAPMHDLGKIAIDDQILRKPGKFSSEEFDVMKTHAEKGCAIVENLLSQIETPFFVEIAKNVACYHHERWDGSGYPFGISGEKIPFEARVMAVADVYDALVSKRCYKDSVSFDIAFEFIVNAMGTHFDPGLKECFVNCRDRLESFYSNTMA